MKCFVDLNLRVPLNDYSQAQQMIQKAHELGYITVGIPLPQNVSLQQIGKLKSMCKKAKVDFVSRSNFSPRNPEEVISKLRRFRRKFEIIAIKCNTRDVARQAAKDRRVDLLQFSFSNTKKRFFDESEAELASQALSSLEIELSPLLRLTGDSRIRLLSCLRKEVLIAKRAKVPITITSGATSEFFLRKPYDFAWLTSLFDLPLASALRALSKNPLTMVERNRKKLGSYYVASGVRIIGKDAVD